MLICRHGWPSCILFDVVALSELCASMSLILGGIPKLEFSSGTADTGVEVNVGI